MVEQHDKVPRTDDCSRKAHDILFPPWRYRRKQLSIYGLELKVPTTNIRARFCQIITSWKPHLDALGSVYIPLYQLKQNSAGNQTVHARCATHFHPNSRVQMCSVILNTFIHTW